MIKQKLQNPVKTTEKKSTVYCQETFLYIRSCNHVSTWFNSKTKKPVASLNLRSHMIRYRVYNYCVYIYLDYR